MIVFFPRDSHHLLYVHHVSVSSPVGAKMKEYNIYSFEWLSGRDMRHSNMDNDNWQQGSNASLSILLFSCFLLLICFLSMPKMTMNCIEKSKNIDTVFLSFSREKSFLHDKYENRLKVKMNLTESVDASSSSSFPFLSVHFLSRGTGNFLDSNLKTPYSWSWIWFFLFDEGQINRPYESLSLETWSTKGKRRGLVFHVVSFLSSFVFLP